jgi:putative flippase GtrA
MEKFLNAILQNPASLAAFFAALVALVSFTFNYRITFKNQRDTQFFEAMKRFGDQESVALRLSAVGLLSQMGLQSPTHFRTAFDQLISGLLVETDMVVLQAITDAAIRMAPKQRKLALATLTKVSEIARVQLFNSMARYIAALTSSESAQRHLHHLTGYSKEAVEIITSYREYGELLERFEALRSTVPPNGNLLQENVECVARQTQAVAQVVCSVFARNLPLFGYHRGMLLRGFLKRKIIMPQFFCLCFFLSDSVVSFDMWSNKKLLGAYLVKLTMSDGIIEYCFFFECNMSSSVFNRTRFVAVHFEDVDLQNGTLVSGIFSFVTMRHTKLNNAKLWGLQIKRGCDLSGANWWTADFSYVDSVVPGSLQTVGKLGRKGDVDEALLEILFRDHAPNILEPQQYGCLRLKYFDDFPEQFVTVGEEGPGNRESWHPTVIGYLARAEDKHFPFLLWARKLHAF